MLDEELRSLIVDLDHAAQTVLPEVKKVVARGALHIKTDWRDRWSGHSHISGLSRAVTYDTTASADQVTAEIGPDKAKRQGALGNLIEFGSINNAPIPGGLPALAAEEPRYTKALEDLGVKLLDGTGD